MAGDDADSWKSQFTAAGCFKSVDDQIAGLGAIGDIQKIYVAHDRLYLLGNYGFCCDVRR